jgi:hypothetical protein
MDRFDDDTDLMTELRELRPTPRREFTDDLDERAAAGFPRRPKPSGAKSSPGTNPFVALLARWRGLSLGGRLVPVLGVAVAVIAIATVVTATTGGGGSGSSAFVESAPSSSSEEAAGGGAEETESGSAEEAEGGEALSEEAEEAPAEEAPEEEGFEGNFFGEESGAAEAEGEGTVHSPEAAVPAIGAQKAKAAGKAAGRQRDIERSAYIVLGTKPGEVAGAAAQVYSAVHAANGIVLHSSVQSGKHGATGASFELLIPSAKLDDTLAAFSQIAEVRERHDATNDITAPTVSAAEELADSNATIDSLLKELGDAETEEERESVEARLHEERRRHAAIRSSLDHLHERASLSEVSVRIVTDKGAGIVAPGAKGDDHWDVGDAAHDAGHILTVAAGVILIGLAVLGPIALIALAIWLGNRFRVRRLRERTLG